MSAFRKLAKMIDHSLLSPTLTAAEVNAGCLLARKYDVASVCVRPCDVKKAADILDGSDVIVSTVIGFPHGTTTTATKVAESLEAMDNGAVELDVVMNIGAMKSGNTTAVENDLKAIIETAHERGAKVKVILECCYPNADEIRAACGICNRVNADWAKTSTGYGPYGARAEALAIMREALLPHIQMQAAGGVRTLEAAREMAALGCTRIGATATAAILDPLADR